MSDTRITFRKAAVGAACGLVGAIVGGFVARAVVRSFEGAPVWELPAIVFGSLALLVAAVLGVVPALRVKAAGRK